MADANKDRGRPPAEPCTRLERGQNATKSPLRRNLATIRKVALDQPVTKCRRLEPVNFVAAADGHLGKKPPIGRAKKPRGRGHAQ